MKALSVLKLLRPQQWVKNGFVFLPMFFGGRMLDWLCWRESLIAFFAFSFAASAIYCLNDIRDVEADRLHPVKRLRPVAAGDVPVGVAFVLMAALVCMSVALCLFALSLDPVGVAAVVVLYLLLNVAYCLKLKQYAIIDVFVVSSGFVLRLVAGGLACGIWLSPWIVSLTFLIALFLAFAKRRDDVVRWEDEGRINRRSITRYNLTFINQILGLIGAITIVCYMMYTVSPEVIERMGSGYVYVTSVFVLAGILRYLQIAIVDRNSGSPTKILLTDRFIQCCMLCWGLLFMAIIYCK